MRPRFFALLIVLMTSSLAGIICLQGYLISDAYKTNEIFFETNVKKALFSVASKIQEQEFLKHFHALKEASKHHKGEGILLPGCQQNDEDSVGREELHKYVSNAMDSVAVSIPADTIVNVNTIKKHHTKELTAISEYEYMLFHSLINEFTTSLDVPHRVNNHLLKYFLDLELLKNNIDAKYEFAVIKSGLPTSIHTSEFPKAKGNIFEVDLFKKIKTNNDIKLYVKFPNKKKFVASSIVLMIVLSTILILVITATFFYAYRLLKRQRKVSEIKTDFINNMTHELKTPIATINLALDFIKNPKVINDENLRATYLNIINEENKRIHGQVENVLQISRLERREIDIHKERVSIHEIIDDAVEKFSEELKNSESKIIKHLEAKKHFVLANSSHFKDVVSNIIDNSLKYNEKTPKINIYSENVKNNIILKFEDNGVGICKDSKKRIFDNFFRESTGNLHNVKGYGLGLSYVKKIVEDHQGEIFVESKKNKGTQFIIKLPLIS